LGNAERCKKQNAMKHTNPKTALSHSLCGHMWSFERGQHTALTPSAPSSLLPGVYVLAPYSQGIIHVITYAVDSCWSETWLFWVVRLPKTPRAGFTTTTGAGAGRVPTTSDGAAMPATWGPSKGPGAVEFMWCNGRSSCFFCLLPAFFTQAVEKKKYYNIINIQLMITLPAELYVQVGEQEFNAAPLE
jgi:hypothetical protein